MSSWDSNFSSFGSQPSFYAFVVFIKCTYGFQVLAFANKFLDFFDFNLNFFNKVNNFILIQTSHLGNFSRKINYLDIIDSIPFTCLEKKDIVKNCYNERRRWSNDNFKSSSHLFLSFSLWRKLKNKIKLFYKTKLPDNWLSILRFFKCLIISSRTKLKALKLEESSPFFLQEAPIHSTLILKLKNKKSFFAEFNFFWIKSKSLFSYEKDPLNDIKFFVNNPDHKNLWQCLFILKQIKSLNTRIKP